MNLNQKITDYISTAPVEQIELLEQLRILIHQSVDGVSEEIKWNFPVFCKTKDFAYLRFSKKHITLGFYNIDKIKDPNNLLEGEGKTLKHIKIKNKEEGEKGENLIKFTNQLIHKVTQNLERFHYNVIVANLYEMYNFLIKEIDKPIKKEVLIESYRKILILMNPFIPHFTSECLNSIDQNETAWPTVAKEDLIEDQINLVVQINGKKRAILKVKRDINQKEILKIIKLNREIEKFLTKQIIKKIIFVPNRLINIII